MTAQTLPSFPLELPEPLPGAVAFFNEWAGWSYDPATESPEEGRARTARHLAQAEEEAERRGWYVEWSDDWEITDHAAEYGEEAYPNGNPETCENADLYDEHGNMIRSLGCIDDADANYRRVVEAELAAEALAEMWAGVA
jgi:hypothetical protein